MSLYGPYPVFTHNPDGSLSRTLAGGLHYTTDVGYLAAHQVTLSAYLASPAHPLQYVLAGDDPARPMLTAPIVFPDATTAEAVIAALDS